MTSSTILAQDRLDVREKSRSNLFNWRGQFTPQFVDYVLDHFARPDNVVMDPFSGSGTVLQECSTKLMPSYGFEINPAAYAMSKFFTFANIPFSERESILSELEKKLIKTIADFGDLPLLQDGGEFRSRYKNLIDFSKELLSSITNKHEKILAINLLFIAEDRAKASLDTTILCAFHYLRKSALSLPYTERLIHAQLRDARTVDKYCPARVDTLFTSPPYINVFNYHQNHRAILEALGWNILKVAQSEIGSNRKNRGNRFRTVIQYCLDMEQALRSFWRSLNFDGVIILIVGRESNVRKTAFYNGAIIRELMIRLAGFKEITNYERKFTNRFGLDIKEDIIISRKTDSLSSESRAKEIALKHLETALPGTVGDIRMDIQDAIENLDDVEQSPLFDVKEIFSNA